MTDLARLLQLPHAAASPGGGVRAYVDDMAQMRTALSAPPQHLSWWTATLLVLAIPALLAGLMGGWIYLNRRIRPPPEPAAPVPKL